MNFRDLCGAAITCTLLAVTTAATAATAGSSAVDCDAGSVSGTRLGTSRTLVMARTGAAYGHVQHAALPLAPGEVVLTFDDGPQPGSTPQILQALAQHCARATFFMTGEALSRAPALGAQVLAQGHTVGAHGFGHPHFAALPEAEQLADLKAAQDVHQRIFGGAFAAYRFPFLEETMPLKNALKAQGITVMSIDVSVDDWLPDQTPQMLTDRLLERLQESGGGIILLHDAQAQTAAALPMMLRALKDKGYRVVHLQWP